MDELRLAALEDRVDADLALGRHSDLVGELETLVRANPLRERPRAQLMLALYRSGRQAEALEAYQETRRVLVEELGIDPSPALQDLERAVLNQDPALEWTPPSAEPAAEADRGAAPPAPERSILLICRDEEDLDALLAITEPLARSRRPHELILARLTRASDGLEEATAELRERRRQLLERRVPSRAAAFTSTDESLDIIRLSSQHEVDLLLLDGRALRSRRATAKGAACDSRGGAVRRRARRQRRFGDECRRGGRRPIRRERARLGCARARSVGSKRSRPSAQARRNDRGSRGWEAGREPSSCECSARRPAASRRQHRVRPGRGRIGGGGGDRQGRRPGRLGPLGALAPAGDR